MEHLMSPKERRERQEEGCTAPSVPWLGFNHDSGIQRPSTIQTYPIGKDHPPWTQRQLHDLELGNLNNRNPGHILGMIQSWMSLGLLESAFNERFHTQLFVSKNPQGTHVVNTAKLREWIDQYHQSTNLEPVGDAFTRQRQRARLVETLEYAQLWILRLAEMARDYRQTQRRTSLAASPLFGPITRFITLVAEAVWSVAMRFPSDGERFFINCQWEINEINGPDLRQRCISRGWCPSIFDKMKRLLRTPTSFMEYLSVVAPLEGGANLHTREDSNGKKCTEAECVLYNVDTNKYKPFHRSNCSGCGTVKPSLAAIKDALDSGRIPVINGLGLLNPNTSPAVETTSDVAPLKFVAFSHVWSDGLGSTTEAGLPTCQVEFLLDKALRAGSTELFWIDSLCIPKECESRKKAVAGMAKTYKSASATVVLDSQIQRCDFERSLETRLLALCMSKWQGRLWTLQESSLSQNLWFLFKDDKLKQIESMISKEYNLKGCRPIVRSTGVLLDNLSDWSSPSQISVGGVQRNLYCRTSSKLDDEALAIAPFFPHVDIQALFAKEGQERMAELFKQLKHVPSDIVVAGPEKLDIDGFRWAPRSFMNQKDSTTLDLRDQSATVTEIGLKVSYWLCELNLPVATPLNLSKLFYDPGKDWCMNVCGDVHYRGITLSESAHAVAFMMNPVPSAGLPSGIVLRRVTDSPFQYRPGRPVYKFVGLVGVDICSQRIPTQYTNADWSRGRQQAEGRTCSIRDAATEIYIR